jgi:high-affinity iron transporter
MGSLFSVPIYFVIFRETTEAAVIVSVLLSFLSQVITSDEHMRKRLARQVKKTSNKPLWSIWVAEKS